jgi:hypothetical protein
MTSQARTFNVNRQGLTSLSVFGGNTLPSSLVIGLIEICAILNESSMGNHVKNISHEFQEMIGISQAFLPEYSQQLGYLLEVFNYVIIQRPPMKALDDLDKLFINIPERLDCIYLASKALIAGMMINKLRSANEQSKIDNFFKDEDYTDFSANILLVFCNKFLVCIKEYEDNQVEGLSKPDKAGVFPLMHLWKHDFKYYLAKTNEMTELKNNPNFNMSLIEDMPFIYGKAKKFCPVGAPQKKQIIVDYRDDIAVFKIIIEKLSEELKSKGGFSNELTLFIRECQSQNSAIRTLPCLVDSPINCSLCKVKLSSNNFTETSHKGCAICDSCMVKGNGICTKCRGALTNDDRSLLVI